MAGNPGKAVAAMYIPRICPSEKPQFKNLLQNLIVGIEIPCARIIEANVKVLLAVFLVERKPPFQLNLQELLRLEMLRDKVCTIPIVR
jgi:hypothetical protein